MLFFSYLVFEIWYVLTCIYLVIIYMKGREGRREGGREREKKREKSAIRSFTVQMLPAARPGSG